MQTMHDSQVIPRTLPRRRALDWMTHVRGHRARRRASRAYLAADGYRRGGDQVGEPGTHIGAAHLHRAPRPPLSDAKVSDSPASPAFAHATGLAASISPPWPIRLVQSH